MIEVEIFDLILGGVNLVVTVLEITFDHLKFVSRVSRPYKKP